MGPVESLDLFFPRQRVSWGRELLERRTHGGNFRSNLQNSLIFIETTPGIPLPASNPGLATPLDDSMRTVKPLVLSEQEMLTKALPDQAPGDVSDAETKVIRDDQLQSTDDWQRIASQIESGELEDQIAAEEAALAEAERRSGQATPPRKQIRQQDDEDDEAPVHQLEEEEDNGSAPPEIGLFGDLQPDPWTGRKPEKYEDPIFVPSAPAPRHQTQEAPAASQDDEDTTPSGEPQKNKPYRFRGEDAVEDLAFELKKKAQEEGRTLHLEKALALAKETLGVESTGFEDTQPENDPTLEGIPGSVPEIKARIRELRKQEVDLLEEMEYDRVREIRAELDRLDDAIPKVEQRQNERQTAYMEGFKASASKAASLYPMVQQDGSDFAKACEAMDRALEESGDKRFHDPNKPLLIARAVAHRMGIMPEVPLSVPRRQSQASAPATSPRAKYQAAPPIPASGQSRQGGHLAPSAPNFDEMTEDQYLSLREQWSN